MSDREKAIIRFDDDGNLNLYGDDNILSQVFRSSDQLESFRAALSDFQTFSSCCPEMVEIINELLPKMPQYVADLPQATRELMQEGKLFLRPDKEGRLLATLINPDNQRIVKNVRLKEVRQIPAVNDMMFSLSFMAITQQLNEIQESIALLRQAQIHDRESKAMDAAQYLQWAFRTTDPEKRASYCETAHHEAIQGFMSCLNTVNESAEFFLSQPSNKSLGLAMVEQVMPWNWEKTFQAAKQGPSRVNELRRSVAKCTYCAQYASAASFMLADKEQVKFDLDMYAEHMSRNILGDKGDHLKLWLSPKSLEGLPLLTGSPFVQQPNNDIISFVESAVSKIKEFDEMIDTPNEISSDDSVETKELPRD
jgi:hypothetical protein